MEYLTGSLNKHILGQLSIIVRLLSSQPNDKIVLYSYFYQKSDYYMFWGFFFLETQLVTDVFKI